MKPQVNNSSQSFESEDRVSLAIEDIEELGK